MIRVVFALGFTVLQLALYAQSYDAELLYYETNTVVSKGKLIRNTKVQVQINNRAGDKYASVSIPYSEPDKLSNIEAFIEDREGRVVRKLKKRDIIEKSDISRMSLYEDDFVRNFTLKHSSYPYTITYSYQLQKDEFLYVDYWIPVLNRKIPTRRARLIVSAPLNYKLAYVSNRVEGLRIDTLDSFVHYTWEADYKEPIEDEELAPPLRDFLPTVRIVPLDFNYEIEGSFRNWTDYGNWESALLEGMQELPESEKRKIALLVEGIDDEQEKIRILYHYLQDETRYINVSIETGGLKPYPASYVSENKYGDCKALSNYFLALLEEAGIRAYYTNVYAGEPIRKICRDFTAQQFNHVILFVPLKQDTIWLDCTSDGAFDYLGTFTQNRDVFVVAKNESRFLRTPALTREEVLESRRIRVPYDPLSTMIVEFENRYHGGMYEALSELDNGYNLNEKARILRNYLVEDGFELIDHRIQKSYRDSACIHLSYTAKTDQVYRQYGQDILVSNFPFRIPDLEEPGDRTMPVQLDYPIYMLDTITYEIPRGYNVPGPPADQVVSGSAGAYSMIFSKQENSIQVVKKLEIFPGLYPLEEYGDFYAFLKEIYRIENKILFTLTKK